jgi:hypothetical protein
MVPHHLQHARGDIVVVEEEVVAVVEVEVVVVVAVEVGEAVDNQLVFVAKLNSN